MNYRVMLIVIVVFCSSICSLASDKKYQAHIAIVDIQAVLEGSLAARAIGKDMEELGGALQKEMLAREEELKDAESRILSQRENMSQDIFEREVMNFNQKVSAAQKAMQVKKSNLDQAHNEAMAKVHEVIISIISQMSLERGFNIAIPSSQVLYATDGINITSDVILALNKNLRSINIKNK